MQLSPEGLCAEHQALLRPCLAAPKEEEEKGRRRRKMNGNNNNLNMLSSPPPSRWRKGELIGSGAFGRVYMGMNLDSGELFAVKQVLIAANSVMKEKAQAHIRELEEEVRLLRNLSHPNIVRYLGTAQEEEALNIFLELVPGGSISSLLGKFGSFPEPVLRMYTKQLLQGLEYLHRNSIMHRDIKGANILVDNKGCIKLADFGASKQVAELVTMTGAKSMKGTPYWMAPEVIRQTGHGLSADIWSVGCTIIEMATGKPPWSQQFQEVAALFHIGTTMSHPPIPEHLSLEAKDFLLKCLQKEPHLRPTASELLQDPFIVESSEGRLSRQRHISPSQSQDLFQSYDKRSLHKLMDSRSIRESGFNPMHEPTSYNPMCEPVEMEGNGWGSPLEEVKAGLEVDMMNELRKSEAEAEFSFQCASADGDGDEVTEFKIKTFLDEKALELKRLQTPLCEEFQSMWKVATGQSGVLKSPALVGRHVRSNSRSPSSGPPSSPMGVGGTCDSVTSVALGSPGGVNLSNSPLGVDASPQEAQQRSPGSSERHKAWKEELQRELEERREERRTLSRLGGNGKASSPTSNSKSNSPNEKNGQRHVARRLSGLASSPSSRSKRD